MPWVDDSGKRTTFESYPVQTPQEVGQSAKKFIKRQAIPLGAMGAAGLALDILAPEAGIPLTLGRMAVMGGANALLNKTLPKQYGGEPDASLAGSFAAGAIPEGMVLGGGRLINRIAERKLANRAGQALDEGLGRLDPDALAPRRALLRPQGDIPYPRWRGGGPRGAAATRAKRPIIESINAVRSEYGAPIGDAYTALKDIEEPISEQSARKLADDAGAVRGDLISPAPRAQATFAKLKAFRPPENWAASAPEMSEEEKVRAMFKQGKGISANGALHFSNEDIANFRKGAVGAQPEYKLPTLDELRELRQQVNTALRTAQGGDRYALGALQDRLDRELMPHLPSKMRAMRRRYAEFMNNWDYTKEAAIAGLGDPQEVVNKFFSDPRDVHDLFAKASPDRREKLREQFLQYVYGDIDKTAPTKEQAAEVRARLKPYMQDPRTAKLVLGPKYREQLRLAVSWPTYVAEFNDQMAKNPKYREGMDREIQRVFVSKGIDPNQAMNAILEREFADVNPAAQEVVQGLPAPFEKAAKPVPLNMRGLMYHGGMLGAGALGGHSMGLGWQGGAVTALLVSHVMSLGGFGAASRMGITRQVLKAAASKSGPEAGRILGRALLEGGTRAIQSRANEPVDLGALQ